MVLWLPNTVASSGGKWKRRQRKSWPGATDVMSVNLWRSAVSSACQLAPALWPPSQLFLLLPPGPFSPLTVCGFVSCPPFLLYDWVYIKTCKPFKGFSWNCPIWSKKAERNTRISGWGRIEHFSQVGLLVDEWEYHREQPELLTSDSTNGELCFSLGGCVYVCMLACVSVCVCMCVWGKRKDQAENRWKCWIAVFL